LAELTQEVLSWLVDQGLVVQAEESLLSHPAYAAPPVPGLHVGLVGDDTLHGPIETALARAQSPVGRALTAEIGIAVVALTASENVLGAVSAWALENARPVLVHAVAGGSLYLGLLRPPHTGCPLCLVRRIRATRPTPELSNIPVAALLGTGADASWPSTIAAAGLVAHQALRVLHNPVTSVQAQQAELVELNLDTHSSVRHPVLPTPHCPACGDEVLSRAKRDVFAGLSDSASVSLSESALRMRRAVDPLTGIVAGVRITEPGESDVVLDCVAAWGQGGTDTRWFSPVRASTVGGACKKDPLTAEVCALGELLERYAAGIYDPKRLVRASLAELGDAAIDPRTMPLGSPREYEAMAGRLVPYHPELVIDWVEGVELRTGERLSVPACAVYVPYQPPSESERLMFSVSTGLAAGSTPAQAVIGGLLEVIERDAAAICWYNTLGVPTIDWQALRQGPAFTVLDRMRRRGLDILAKDITTDIGIPSVMLLGRFGTPQRPVALCGFRADLDPHTCLFGAAQELEHVLTMYRRFMQLGSTLNPDKKPIDIWDYTTYYCHSDRISALDFLYEGPVQAPPAPVDHPLTDSETLKRAVERLCARGYQPVAVDVTPVDVAECGVTVARSVIPEFQPVAFHETFRRLGGTRVQQAPVRMGLRTTPLSEHEFNPLPIPMG
jgi:ribosomal protein S12 methylthiotransferase accessory factor